MAKVGDEIKIQDLIHKYRMLEIEFKQGDVSRRSLAEAAYDVAEAYLDVNPDHTPLRDELKARKWVRKGKSHSIRFAYEGGYFHGASRKLRYLEYRRMDRYCPDWLVTVLVLVPPAIVIPFVIYTIVASLLK